jgi:HlyD family secretion protein
VKRVIPIIILAAAVAAFVYRSHWLPQPHGEGRYLGYAENETTLVAAPVAGRLSHGPAPKGTQVEKSAPLFSLDDAQQTAAVAQAEAALATARAQLANLETGRRPEEKQVIEAQISEAEAALALATKDFARARDLARTGTASQTRLDQASSQVDQLTARIAGLRAQHAVAALPARENEIAAARAKVEEAAAALRLASAKLWDLTPRAPATARIDDTYFEEGEWVAAGQPVLALIDPARVYIRLFIPETVRSVAGPGTVISYSCDGCPEGLTARITHVSASPEYTPPVIYSQDSRRKLVFSAEAEPIGPAPFLQPGLPLSVEPLP